MQEIWQPIPFGTCYEVSNKGRVRNTKTGKILTGTINEDGYRRVCLSAGKKHKSFYVHKLVAEAFLDAPLEGQQVRHWDGNPDNNDLSNLLYGTGSENIFDAVRHGTHYQARKTHCPQDHEYSEENTYFFPDGRRHCKVCTREAGRRYDQGRKRVTVNGKRVWVRR
jgi:hypothetical protein